LIGQAERECIHCHHINSLSPLSSSFSPYTGFTGADIANICNEAAIVAARRNKTSVDLNDFEVRSTYHLPPSLPARVLLPVPSEF